MQSRPGLHAHIMVIEFGQPKTFEDSALMVLLLGTPIKEGSVFYGLGRFCNYRYGSGGVSEKDDRIDAYDPYNTEKRKPTPTLHFHAAQSLPTRADFNPNSYVIVFDATNPESFKEAQETINKINAKQTDNMPTIQLLARNAKTNPTLENEAREWAKAQNNVSFEKFNPEIKTWLAKEKGQDETGTPQTIFETATENAVNHAAKREEIRGSIQTNPNPGFLRRHGLGMLAGGLVAGLVAGLFVAAVTTLSLALFWPVYLMAAVGGIMMAAFNALDNDREKARSGARFRDYPVSNALDKEDIISNRSHQKQKLDHESSADVFKGLNIPKDHQVPPVEPVVNPAFEEKSNENNPAVDSNKSVQTPRRGFTK